MSVYMIAEITVQDPEPYLQYVSQVPAMVAKYGGKYVVRGGPATNLIGDWQPGRIIVIEFPSMDHVQSWFNSEEYQAIKHLRECSTLSRGIVVEGYERS